MELFLKRLHFNMVNLNSFITIRMKYFNSLEAGSKSYCGCNKMGPAFPDHSTKTQNSVNCEIFIMLYLHIFYDNKSTK